MITFHVSDVRAPARCLRPMATQASFERALGQGFEASGTNASGLVDFACPNLFLGAATAAFANHYPLALSPDTVWLAIAQGLALHVNNDASRLRHKFVDPRVSGRTLIKLRRDGFRRGAPDNDWPGCFDEFTTRIRDHVGSIADAVTAGFSTSGPIERAASQVTLMDAVQGYFEYRVETRCGIPSVTLLGTVDDWRSIRRRAALFEGYDLGWWTEALLPACDELVNAASGRPDTALWRSFVKENDVSGGTVITGWINAFFPYLKDPSRAPTVRNAYMRPDRWNSTWQGAHTDDFPSGFASAPFVWEYFGQELAMRFVAGFAGVAQDERTLAVAPAIGWAVSDAAQGALRR